MVEHPGYKQIRASMLGIYAVYKKPVQLLPVYSTADLGTRAAMDKIFDIWQTFAREQRDAFRKVPHARIVEIEGASHYVFISHPGTVLEEMQKFLRAPE
jgi:pimeloyl-ACP methyl ester carboxylesterase